MMPSTPSCVLSRVMQTCSGTSSGTSRRLCMYATRSMNGMIRLRPGSSTAWNLPRRSTTQACCCGTMRTPSITNTTMIASRKIQPAYFSVAGNCVAAIDSTIATISLGSMGILPISLACDHAGSGEALGCDLECAAFGCGDIDDCPWSEWPAARDARIPRCATVAHAREARRFVGPRLETCRLAGIDRCHLAAGIALVPCMHQVATDGGERAGDRGLRREAQSQPPEQRAAERRATKHQQAEPAAEQLY